MTGRFIPALIVAATVTACQGGSDGSQAVSAVSRPALTAATLGEQTVMSNAEYLASDEFAGADPAWGERLAMQCRACHSLDPGGNHMIGPALYGFFGRRAGSAAGYAYSDALSQSDFVWTPTALDAWLAQPATFLPGNRMTYAGLSKADDRRAVIAYLLAATDGDSGT